MPDVDADTRLSRAAKSLRTELPAVLLGLCATGIIQMVLQGLWRLSPHVPMSYSGDSNLTMSAIRNMVETGWYTTTDQLGVPYGQNLSDFPAVGDHLHLILLWGLTRLSSSPGLVLNAFFLLTYLTVWLGGYIGSRMLRLTRPVAVVVGLLYTFLPYHWLQNQDHAFLASYGSVPIWCALLIRQLGAEPIVGEAPASLSPKLWWGWVRERGTMWGLLIVAVSATTGLYYVVFFVVLAMIVAVVTGATLRSWRRGLATALMGGLGGFVLALQFLSPWLYQRRQGSNTSITERGLAAVEFYSLKLSDLIVPVPGHRLSAFAQINEDSRAVFLKGEPAAQIGLLAVIGLFAIVGVALARAVRREPGGRVGATAVVAVSAFMVGTVGGLGQILGVLGFTHLRVWSRICVVIAFCAMVGVGIGLEHVRRVRRARLAAWPAWLVFLAVVAGLSILDTNPPTQFGSFETTATIWASDRTFVGRVEEFVRPTATVFQLPVVPFPENPPVYGMGDYDHLRGYIHSKRLRWSYGGVKGRESMWQERLADMTPTEAIESVAIAGFDALWIDRYGYADAGAEMDVAALAVAGAPIVSSEGRFAVYDLRPLRAELEADLGTDETQRRAAALLLPVDLLYGEGFSVVETSDAGTYSWAGTEANLVVRNFQPGKRRVRLEFSVQAAVPGEHSLRITGPGIDQTVTLVEAPRVLTFDIDVSGLSVDLSLVTDAPRRVTTDPRDIRFRVIDPTVTDAE